MPQQPNWSVIFKRSFVLLAIVFVVVCVVIAVGRMSLLVDWPDWTGFNTYITPKVNDNQSYQREKTLWDWLGLLIIPLVLALGGFWLNRAEKQREEMRVGERDQAERSRAEQQAQLERAIATDNQREAALQAYFDRMSELLLNNGLRTSHLGDEVRAIARTRTITVLEALDGPRKGRVVRFLAEAGLLSARPEQIATHPIISLRSANLSGADLQNISLVGTDLSNANLSGCRLWRANMSNVTRPIDDSGSFEMKRLSLRNANLTKADLSEASLEGVDMEGANLSGAILYQAFLKDADVFDVDFSYADLTCAWITGLGNCRSLRGATLSDGTTVPEDETLPFIGQQP